MFTRNQCLKLAAAGALVALTAASIPAYADELAQNLGPVGPHEPILTTVGSKRIIAFYEPDSGRCAVHAVAWDNADADSVIAKFGPDPAHSAVRVRISLNPGQMVHIDSPANKSLNLQCGDNAETLAIVGPNKLIAGVAE
jgi:hypothetical protein